jgi:hypothetical protein
MLILSLIMTFQIRLLDPDLDQLVRGMDPDPDPLSPSKIVRKTLVPTTLWLIFDFLSLKNDVNVP